MILVDSSVWIAYFNGAQDPRTDLLDQLLGSNPLVIGDLILTEVLQGFRSDRDFRTARKLLETLEFQPMLGCELAIKSADNYRNLRRKGVTIRKTIDVTIATFCIERGHQLLHADRDFEPMQQHLGLETLVPLDL